jgi:uncharacterized cupredoxin-like copper-binding protein
MTGRRRRFLVAVAAMVVAACAAAVVQAAAGEDRGGANGPGEVTVDLRIAHSRFHSTRIDVVEGTTVHFAIHNEDPIGHEFIVGDAAVHARHERGTEAAHPPVDGELSLPPLSDGTTSFTFDRSGTVVFACHLPGHLAYGMRGEVVVRSA